MKKFYIELVSWIEQSTNDLFEYLSTCLDLFLHIISMNNINEKTNNHIIDFFDSLFTFKDNKFWDRSITEQKKNTTPPFDLKTWKFQSEDNWDRKKFVNCHEVKRNIYISSLVRIIYKLGTFIISKFKSL